MMNAMTSKELAHQFAALNPWISGFTIDGEHFGGTYDPSNDGRLTAFFEHFGSAKRILELGSLEGAHSRFLSTKNSAEVVGIEGRAANVKRAEFIAHLFDLSNVRFLEADLETYDLSTLGSFDAVFCVGLLYHLQRPWPLLRKLRDVSPNLLLATHYMPDDRANTILEGYRGGYYKEFGIKDPLSGLYPRSFWPDRESLLQMVVDAGFMSITICADQTDHPHGPLITLAAKSVADVGA